MSRSCGRAASVACQRLGGETELSGDEADHAGRQLGRIRNRPALRPRPSNEQRQPQLVPGAAGSSNQAQILRREREETGERVLAEEGAGSLRDRFRRIRSLSRPTPRLGQALTLRHRFPDWHASSRALRGLGKLVERLQKLQPRRPVGRPRVNLRAKTTKRPVRLPRGPAAGRHPQGLAGPHGAGRARPVIRGAFSFHCYQDQGQRGDGQGRACNDRPMSSQGAALGDLNGGVAGQQPGGSPLII